MQILCTISRLAPTTCFKVCIMSDVIRHINYPDFASIRDRYTLAPFSPQILHQIFPGTWSDDESGEVSITTRYRQHKQINQVLDFRGEIKVTDVIWWLSNHQLFLQQLRCDLVNIVLEDCTIKLVTTKKLGRCVHATSEWICGCQTFLSPKSPPFAWLSNSKSSVLTLPFSLFFSITTEMYLHRIYLNGVGHVRLL